MDRIRVIARFSSIPGAHLAEFKEAAAQALAIADGEAGTLRYDWFLSDDESACVVLEEYENSNAVLVHVGGLGELFGKLLELGGGCTFEVFGQPSDELVAATASLQLSVFPSLLQGK